MPITTEVNSGRQIQKSVWKSPAIVNMTRTVLSDTDVTWQPRRVDWKAHV